MDRHDIDEWVASIRKEGGRACTCTEEYIDPFRPSMYIFQSVCADRFVRIESEGYDPFYCYFQPCFQKTAPLIVHTPGYGGEMSMHPELAQYFNVLHINPLGYTTPKGKDMSKMVMNNWGAVLPDTIRSGGESGYRTWLINCVMAVNWALAQDCVLKDRVSFFGTSQGGGAALLLGSVFNDITRATASDEPFLTNFKMAAFRGAYGMGRELYEDVPAETIERAIYLIDTVNHIHRFNFPILLTSGGKDDTCPPETVADLFERLPGTKSYTHFSYLPHGYNREFVQLAKAWFLIYA
ncbi:MAG: acetylxylan esterase [Clostridia bacterium]|nr:acetylxylan esterase [Clostridia bacterium]